MHDPIIQEQEEIKLRVSDDAESSILAEHYRIESEVGKGNWSTVFRGTHLRLQKPVAIKFLNAEIASTPQRLQRFQQEAKLAGSLNHGNIVRVFDFGCTPDNRPYTVMDFVDGKSLTTLINEQAPFACDRAARLGLDIARALEHAHLRNVIHRDIKPDNILIESDANGHEIPKLTDFGIAKALRPESDDAGVTRTGEIVGTPQYMSPEQCSGKQLDGKADVYSFGCILFEMVTGQKAFDGRSAFECMREHLEKRIEEVFPGKNLSPEQRSLQRIILACLEKDPAQRIDSSMLVVALQRHCLGEFAQAQAALGQSTQTIGKPRSRPAFAIGAIIGLFLICGLFTYFSAHHTVEDPLVDDQYTRQLKHEFDSIRLSIKEAREQRQFQFADKMQAELFAFEDQLNNKHAQSVHLDLGYGAHVISVAHPGSGKSITVKVTYRDAPIDLVLRSLDNAHWTVLVEPGVKLNGVYFVSPEHPQGTIHMLGGGLQRPPLPKRITNDNTLRFYVPEIDSPEQEKFSNAIHNYCPGRIATIQGAYQDQGSWVVGPENISWRAQAILKEMQPLRAEAATVRHLRVKNWIRQNHINVLGATVDDPQLKAVVDTATAESFGSIQGAAKDDTGNICVLEITGLDVPRATSILRYSPQGKLIDHIPLASPIPLEFIPGQQLHLRFVAPYLVATTDNYACFIDPKTGSSMLNLPLSELKQLSGGGR